MQTFTPVQGMIVCANGTGDYVKKAEVLAEIERILSGMAQIRALLSPQATGRTAEQAGHCDRCAEADQQSGEAYDGYSSAMETAGF